MKVILPGEIEWRELGALEAFGIPKNQPVIISIVGAGGKTTTLEALAEDYVQNRRKAVVTTTTHMFYPENKWRFTESEEPDEIADLVKQQEVLWVGKACENNKFKQPNPNVMEYLCKGEVSVLVEGDGSKRLPFKVPGEKEPVLADNTSYVIGVLGLDGLKQKISKVCFRKEMVSSFLNKTQEDCLTEEDFAKVIGSKEGLKKKVAEWMHYIVVLNKADTKEKIESAFQIRRQVLEYGIENVYITSYEGKEGKIV
ncbi:MAG: selenium cofactor biosynthesis protein YqeC [Acetivibrio sp.]